MRFVASILIGFIGLSGCTKYSHVGLDGASTHLTELEWSIDKLNEVTWKVGKALRDIVTRNLTIVIHTPKFTEADEAFLKKTYGIDGWLLRVTHQSPTGKLELGTLNIPFRGDNHDRGGGMAVKSVSFSLTYAPAAMSERLRGFNCPAFSHNKRLDDYQMEGDKRPVDVVVQAGANFDEKLHKNELVPMTYNIGHSMVGTYSFEVVLFNSAEKKIYSSYKALPFTLKVASEKAVEINGCAGVHQEYDAPEPPRAKPGYVPRVHR